MAALRGKFGEEVDPDIELCISSTVRKLNDKGRKRVIASHVPRRLRCFQLEIAKLLAIMMIEPGYILDICDAMVTNNKWEQAVALALGQGSDLDINLDGDDGYTKGIVKTGEIRLPSERSHRGGARGGDASMARREKEDAASTSKQAVAIAGQPRNLYPHGLPFVLSEFNSGLGLFCCHDTHYAGAFLAYTAVRLQEQQQQHADLPQIPVGMSYWTFSDIFEEMHSVNDNVGVRPLFHNAYGLINVDGIPKPSFRAFELLRRMPNMTLPVKTIIQSTHDNWVSVVAGVPDKESCRMELLLVSFAPAPSWGAVETWNVSMLITDLLLVDKVEAGDGISVDAQVYRIDDKHANAWAKWKRMGSPDRSQANASVISALNESSALVGEQQDVSVDIAGTGSVEMNVIMPKIGIAFLEIRWSGPV